MKKAVIVVMVVAATVMAVSPCIGGEAAPTTEARIREILELHARACEKKDVNAIMAMFAPDPNIVAIGTAQDERLVGPARIRAAYERDFARVISAKLNYTWMTVGSKGDVAWFAAEMVAGVDTGTERIIAPARWTGVLEKRDGKWLFVLSHFSLPIPRDRAGQLQVLRNAYTAVY